MNSTRGEKLDRKINSIISLGDTKTAVLSFFNASKTTTARRISTRLSDRLKISETTTKTGVPLSIGKFARYRKSGCDKKRRFLERQVGQPVESIDGSKSSSVTVER